MPFYRAHVKKKKKGSFSAYSVSIGLDLCWRVRTFWVAFSIFGVRWGVFRGDGFFGGYYWEYTLIRRASSVLLIHPPDYTFLPLIVCVFVIFNAFPVGG